MSDPVDHPPHYRADTGFEAIDVIEGWKLGFNLGNVVKYISRAGLKVSTPFSPMEMKEKAVEDLEKARWYLDREIARLKRESDEWMIIDPNPDLAKLFENTSVPSEPRPSVPPPQAELVQLPRSAPLEIKGEDWSGGSPCRLR